MAIPANFPPKKPSGIRTLNFYKEGTATTDYADNAYLFADGVGANPFTAITKLAPGDISDITYGTSTQSGQPMGGGSLNGPANTTGTQAKAPLVLWSNSISITNTGANDILFSFDGTNTAGRVKAGTTKLYNFRIEGGIAIKSVSATSAFYIEVW